MRLEILDQNRQEIFKKLAAFNRNFILGGGTALALQIKHRRSYDFDLFSQKPIPPKLLSEINQIFTGYRIKPLVDNSDELTVILGNDFKLSFIFYPFPKKHPFVKNVVINLFSLDDLASSKAYTIGRRGVWRDYADLFCLLQHGLNLQKIILEAEQRFQGNFNAKLFLEQLVYFDDITDYQIDFLDKNYTEQEIKKYLTKKVKETVSKT